MKKFTINCDFGGQMAPFSIYIGIPEKGHHPLHFQADWLSKERGGNIPGEIMDAIGKLQELAEKNNVLLEELCVYSLGSAQQDDSDLEDVTDLEDDSADSASDQSIQDDGQNNSSQN
jgi:hypothetical protein